VDINFATPANICLYCDTDFEQSKIDNLATFLKRYFLRSIIIVRKNFFSYWLQQYSALEEKIYYLAKKLAQFRVHHPKKKVNYTRNPLLGEINFELKFLRSDSIKPRGVIYDGVQVMKICSELITPDESTWEYCHIIITNQLLGTWDENDGRYHIRVSIYGFPSIISTSGIIEGPAKPREYYLGLILAPDQKFLKNDSNLRSLEHGDPRILEVTKGYLLQALFYHLTGDPFCNNRDCRLFNAHWQEEMFYAQLRPGADLCDVHYQILNTALGGKI